MKGGGWTESLLQIVLHQKPDQYWKVEAMTLKSQGKNTPFLGMELQGRVKYTLSNGIVVYED